MVPQHAAQPDKNQDHCKLHRPLSECFPCPHHPTRSALEWKHAGLRSKQKPVHKQTTHRSNNVCDLSARAGGARGMCGSYDCCICCSCKREQPLTVQAAYERVLNSPLATSTLCVATVRHGTDILRGVLRLSPANRQLDGRVVEPESARAPF